MKSLLLLGALGFVTTTVAQEPDDFRPAVVVDAVASVETVATGIEAYSYPANQIAVLIDGMIVTATYATWSTSGKNAAGAFIVGDTVLVKFDGRRNQKLIVQVPGGSTVRAEVIRRERAAAVAELPASQ